MDNEECKEVYETDYSVEFVDGEIRVYWKDKRLCHIVESIINQDVDMAQSGLAQVTITMFAKIKCGKQPIPDLSSYDNTKG